MFKARQINISENVGVRKEKRCESCNIFAKVLRGYSIFIIIDVYTCNFEMKKYFIRTTEYAPGRSFVFPPRDEFPGKRRKSESPYFESNSSFGRRHVARSVRVYFLPVQRGSAELASRGCV